VRGVLSTLLEQAGAAAHELITLYYGNGVGEADAAAAGDAVRQAYPDQQVDLIYGGQPHYYYVVGIE
jgi:hypothetical protein